MSTTIVSPYKQDQEKTVFASVSPYPPNILHSHSGGPMPTFSEYIIPKDYDLQVVRAKEYREIDLVNMLLRMYVDYALPIKGFKCNNKRQKKFYDMYVLPMVKRFARQWIYELHSIGEVYAHFGFNNDDRTPLFLYLEDITNIKPIEAFGMEAYKFRISETLKQQIEQLISVGQIGRLPKYIQKIIKNESKKKYITDNTLVLTRENMYRSCLLKQDYEKRAKPPLMRIAKAIELREILLDCDFTGALNVKNGIVHAKVGTKEKPAGKERIEQVGRLLTNQPPGTFFFTTGYDVDIKKVDTMDVGVWDANKFVECNRRILEFFGISTILIPGESNGSYSNGVISIKSFEQAIETDRTIFQEFLDHYFSEINRRNSYTEPVSIIWKRVNLRESKEFQSEVEFLVNQGIYSWKDVCEVYDLNPEEQLEKRKWDHEQGTVLFPVFEKSQGGMEVLYGAQISNTTGEPGKSGRPKTDTNNKRNTSQPRPGQ